MAKTTPDHKIADSEYDIHKLVRHRWSPRRLSIDEIVFRGEWDNPKPL
jgi:hypothetical protein